MKKKLAATLSVVLILGLATLGILAYLMDSDSDVNVMTLGNVQIEQIEQARDVNGDLVDFAKYGNPAAYPAVGPVEWAEDGVDVNGTNYKVFSDELKNVVDKIVTVKNTGKSPAYIRTLVAIEAPDGDPNDLIHVNVNKTGLTMTSWLPITVNGVDYVYSCFTYDAALASGATSVPSLMQVFLDSAATNEAVDKFGENWEILVLSQAGQTNGFDIAATGLDTMFGVPEAIADNGKKNVVNWFELIWNEYEAELIDSEVKLKAAIEAGKTPISIAKSFTISEPINVLGSVDIIGNGHNLTRANGFTGTMIQLDKGATLTLKDVVLDGAGATATGNLIAAGNNSKIILETGSVLQNNVGAHAINLGTRIGATLTINGGEIINNSSDSGAIWGGGHITMNSGKISNNSSTGSAGAIRMVGSCNFTMNGGEINHNKAAGEGGAIWGYGVNGNTSVYNLNGGEIAYNEAGTTGGGIYTGTYSTVNISGDFELHNNTAADSGALRITNYTIFNMTGGKIYDNESTGNDANDGFYGWCPRLTITGGELFDNITLAGGHTPTVGGSGIIGVVNFNIGTNHNTINLAKDFGTIKFIVATGDNFNAFNFKPAAGYTYTAGDESKLICMNEGYETYWDATTGTFRLKAK